MTIQYTATCLFGLESLLGSEIDRLGYKRINTMDGRVTFEGDEATIARCNINLRYAERLFIKMGEFGASTFDELFEGTKAIEWEKYIGQNDAFPVKGHAIKSKLYSIPDCQSIVKKAVSERLGKKYGITWLPETEIKYQIEFFIFKDSASLMIDTSGAPLHKRGYRPQSTEAPLRETLSAALATLARPREDVLFWDPFCGSGTIAIEAALLMTNTAPGINRSFSGESYPQFDAEIWNDARDEAIANIKEDSSFEVYASDIDPSAVELTKANIKRAGVSSNIKAFVKDALTIETGGRRGTIVCNPPYGERLFSIEETENLYRNMGKHFKTLDKWQIYIITNNENFSSLYGRRADKIRKLYNGMIPCYFYQYFKN